MADPGGISSETTVNPALPPSRVGDNEQARQWYAQGVQWMEQNKLEDEELRCFRVEAAKFLKVEDRSDPVPTPK